VSETYRVGRHQAQNVYRGEQYIGVMFAPEDAALTVSTLNGVQPIEAVTDLLRCANELIGEDRDLLLRDQVDNGCGWCGGDHLAELKRAFGGASERKGEPVALIDLDGERWVRVGLLDLYRLAPAGATRSRAYIDGNYGPVTEVWS
jgi:hypothetical protein